MHIESLKRIIEAALLAASQPLSADRIAALFVEDDLPTPADIAGAIEQLRVDCDDRGVELVEVASGFRYQVREDVHAWVARLWAERPARYSRALLETVSLIAYRQPITRGEIEQVRGVVVSTGIIRTLEEREWIRVVGYRDVPGKPALYGTTRQFLDYFKLKSLDQLPPLAEVRDMEAFEPQLRLDGDAVYSPIPAAAALDAEGDAAVALAADVDAPTDATSNHDNDPESMTDASDTTPDIAPEETRA